MRTRSYTAPHPEGEVSYAPERLDDESDNPSHDGIPPDDDPGIYQVLYRLYHAGHTKVYGLVVVSSLGGAVLLFLGLFPSGAALQLPAPLTSLCTIAGSILTASSGLLFFIGSSNINRCWARYECMIAESDERARLACAERDEIARKYAALRTKGAQRN